MADTIKSFTNESEFRNIGTQGIEINQPHLFYNGNGFDINNSGVEWQFRYANGTPTYQDGIKGQSVKLNGGHGIFPSAGVPASNKYMVSAWVKPSAYDVATDTTWSIMATNRGHGWPNNGFHLAIYNDSTINGQVNVRGYGSSGTTDLYSYSGVEGTGTFTLAQDEWTHIAVVYDQSNQYPVRVYFNGELDMFTSTDPDMTAGHGNSFTIGDMITGSEASQYPFDGEIDDVVYLYGEDVWTPQQINDYVTTVTGGQFIDYETKPGSMVLGRVNGGLRYTTTALPWVSESIDLGTDGFVDYGIVNVNGTFPAGTYVDVYTRTSSDESTWTNWEAVNQRNEINSPNRRFVQIRVILQSADGVYTPTVESIDVIQKTRVVLPDLSVDSDADLKLFEDLESGMSALGVLHNAYEIIIEEEVKGEDLLTFKVPINDMKRKEIGDEPVEMVAVLGNRYYTIKEVYDRRDDTGKPFTEFISESRWTELRDWFVDGLEVTYSTARNALEQMVAHIFRESGDPAFNWTIGHVFTNDSTLESKLRSVSADWKDVLSVIRDIEETWGGELMFDTENRVIHLLGKIGGDSGVNFYYEKNLKNIERQVDTYDLITRIYPTGEGELDITTVNDGVPYLENREWVDKLGLRRKVIPYKWKDKRYTVPLNLKEDGRNMLDEMAKPKVSYTTEIRDLSELTGHEHESFNLGDVITAVDNDLFGEEIVNRVMRRKQDVRTPEKTVVELSQPKKTLADVRSRAIDDQIEDMAASDPLSKSDAQQMTVFNNLLNSRADDGFSYWVHEANGTEFELANAGFSGAWSWKVVPDYGVDAQMTQTVEGVSHRSTYTVSASVAHEGDITRGSSDDAFIGIKVLVYYEGEAEPEVHYLGVPDVTDQGGS